MAAANDDIDSKHGQWIHLHSGKEFSRLLYPNPVCFLSTRQCSPESMLMDTSTSAANNKGDVAKENVMVLSWLTPTNNSGRFMFSINKKRYSASLLAPTYTNTFEVGVEFTLSVPVQGMEQMVLDVGSISGQYGSKFWVGADTIINNDVDPQEEHLSNRQRKTQRRIRRKEQLSRHGVEGLVPTRLGSSEVSSQRQNGVPQTQTSCPSPIKGTVAHLKCRTYAVIGSPSSLGSPNMAEKDTTIETHGEKVGDTAEERSNKIACERGIEKNTNNPSIIDDDHLLVMAEVIDAYVHRSYWNEKKLLFQPLLADVPPYLTFLGSQTFGYVTSGDRDSGTDNIL